MTDIIAIVNSLWYESLVDDCTAIITEAVFNSRWELIAGYHALGRRITTDDDYQQYANGNGRILQDLAECIGQSERTLYYAIQFYLKFPDLEKLPDGKNISWTKIITQYLPDGHHTEARSFKQRLTSFEVSLEKFLNKYPDSRVEIIQAIHRVIGGEWR